MTQFIQSLLCSCVLHRNYIFQSLMFILMPTACTTVHVSWRPWSQKVTSSLWKVSALGRYTELYKLYLHLPCTPNLWPTTNILLSTVNLFLTSFTMRFIFFHYGKKYIIHYTCKIKLILHMNTKQIHVFCTYMICIPVMQCFLVVYQWHIPRVWHTHEHAWQLEYHMSESIA